ncbi:MAG: hypothetical protein LBR26_10065 [Prevotella sp.]|jgi:hypothetical protein|nr:hypothetical protein [Prevotella sp.]
MPVSKQHSVGDISPGRKNRTTTQVRAHTQARPYVFYLYHDAFLRDAGAAKFNHPDVFRYKFISHAQGSLNRLE